MLLRDLHLAEIISCVHLLFSFNVFKMPESETTRKDLPGYEKPAPHIKALADKHMPLEPS